MIATAGSGIVFLGSALVLLWFFVFGNLALPRLWRVDHLSQRDEAAQNCPRLVPALCRTLDLGATRRGPAVEPGAFGFFAVAVDRGGVLRVRSARSRRSDTSSEQARTPWLIDFVPGFDGLRVPARFLMLVALFLSVLAGAGAAALLRIRWRALAIGIIAAGMTGILFEAWVAPIGINQPVIPDARFFAPDPPAVGRRMNPIYRVVRQLPEATVLVEFPFGEPAYEIFAVFYAGDHRRKLVNGYSGFFPRSYTDRVAALHDVTTESTAGRRMSCAPQAPLTPLSTKAHSRRRRGARGLEWLRVDRRTGSDTATGRIGCSRIK